MAESIRKFTRCRRTTAAALIFSAALVLTSGSQAVLAADHTPPPLHQTSSYPCSETHPAEHITIAIDPYDSPEKEKFFRFDYLAIGFLPIRFIVQNDSDKSIDLNQARILFLTAYGDHINAATLDDLDRAGGALSMHPPGSITPLPFPFPNKPRDNHIKLIKEDYDLLGYSAVLVAPHTTASGFLWYDISGLEKPILKGAQMYIRTMRSSAGKQLRSFSIPFDKSPHTQ